MTDNEIIKALECCTKWSCDECPIDHTHGCLSDLQKDAFDLIQKQQAEIERLTVELQAMRGAAGSYKAEVERLKNDIFCISNEKDAYANIVNTTADEAIKEFADKLKEKIPFYEGWGYITIKKIDNLVKEMVGADNGNNDTKP